MYKRFLWIAVINLALFSGSWARAGEKAKPATGLAYSGFTLLTPQPVLIPQELFLRCDRSGIDELEASGPHAQPAVKYLANAEAAKVLSENPKANLPTGSVIVKEKFSDAKKEAKLYAYAAMIKREKGYDPDHGDWEYVYADLSGKKPKIERGKIASCIDCHAMAKERDYLFRQHLGKKSPAEVPIELKLTAKTRDVLEIIILNNDTKTLKIPYRNTPLEHISVELQGEQGKKYTINLATPDEKATPGLLTILPGRSKSFTVHTCHYLPEVAEPKEKVTFKAHLKYTGNPIEAAPISVSPPK